MGFLSGTADVTEKAAPICDVPENGVRVRNTGSSVIYVGGPDVGNTGDSAGFPIDPGRSEDFTGARAKESPVVPAPPGDMDPAVLYARCEPGAAGKVSWISVSMT